MKLIDLKPIIQRKRIENPTEWRKYGKKKLLALDQHDAKAIFDFVREYSLMEVKINKGLVKESTDTLNDDTLFEFANKVDDVYSEASYGCYFCDPKADPNERFDGSQRLCMWCQMKLENILAFYNFIDKTPRLVKIEAKQGRTPMVSAEDGTCPKCGEKDRDKLEWMEPHHESIHCATCGHEYTPLYACQKCGERAISLLSWDESGNFVTCERCGNTYQPFADGKEVDEE